MKTSMKSIPSFRALLNTPHAFFHYRALPRRRHGSCLSWRAAGVLPIALSMTRGDFRHAENRVRQ